MIITITQNNVNEITSLLKEAVLRRDICYLEDTTTNILGVITSGLNIPFPESLFNEVETVSDTMFTTTDTLTEAQTKVSEHLLKVATQRMGFIP